ncbi:MAG TPA: UvrB/UvrC motif-containing protein [Kiritimatiellia bacterium]|nr:UvrB/UvrC motif-containing protein [Kiritimatiellia bacterium]
MKCEACQHVEATVHLTQVVDGAIKKLHLCEGCAQKSGFDVQGPISITDILLGMGGKTPAAEPIRQETTCPRCHMRRTDFKKTGRFGCAACYTTFAEDLPPLLKAMHRGTRHIGKFPAREQDRRQVSEALERLHKELDRAVSDERYEEAARLRDEIRQCREKLTSAKAEST